MPHLLIYVCSNSLRQIYLSSYKHINHWQPYRFQELLHGMSDLSKILLKITLVINTHKSK